jgi:hypothetical protein
VSKDLRIRGYFSKLVKEGREQQILENLLLINEFKFDSIAVIICVRSGDRRVMQTIWDCVMPYNPV